MSYPLIILGAGASHDYVPSTIHAGVNSPTPISLEASIGAIFEKRELLACLKSKLTVANKILKLI